MHDAVEMVAVACMHARARVFLQACRCARKRACTHGRLHACTHTCMLASINTRRSQAEGSALGRKRVPPVRCICSPGRASWMHAYGLQTALVHLTSTSSSGRRGSSSAYRGYMVALGITVRASFGQRDVICFERLFGNRDVIHGELRIEVCTQAGRHVRRCFCRPVGVLAQCTHARIHARTRACVVQRSAIAG